MVWTGHWNIYRAKESLHVTGKEWQCTVWSKFWTIRRNIKGTCTGGSKILIWFQRQQQWSLKSLPEFHHADKQTSPILFAADNYIWWCFASTRKVDQGVPHFVQNSALYMRYCTLLPSPVQVPVLSSLNLMCLNITVRPSHPPTRESIFDPLLDHLAGWNLVWKLNSTK